MKKLISVLLVTALGASVLTSCSSTETAGETAAPQETTVVAEQPQDDFSYEMTDDLNNLFSTAMEGWVGANYEPVAFLGVPADNPLGSSFLCRSTMVVPDAVPFWSIVTVQDVGSSVTVEDIKVIDYAASSTSDTAVLADGQDGEPLLGGWTDADEDVTAEVVTMCASALDGGNYSVPVAVLATQVVSGTNYCVLVRDNDAGAWTIAFIYLNLEGHAEATNLAALNI